MLQSYLKDLAELVNMDCGTHNCAGVTRAAEIMKRHYESIGFHAELVDLGDKAGRGLFATNKPGAKHFDVLFNAHLDTVFPDGTAAERPMSIVGDHVMGPGCSDCKSGVLSIFYAIKNAAPADLERLAIAVALNPDEETGSKNSGKWLESLSSVSTRALVCEAARANGALVRSRKGSSGCTVTFHGVTAHAGNNPKDGRSAIMAAARFATEVVKLQDDAKGTTVNVGTFNGGSAVNVVADKCVLGIDTRCLNDADGKALVEGIKALTAQNWGDGITAECTVDFVIPAMPFSDLTKVLVEQITEAARQVGFTTEWVDAGGASDANHIAMAGTPVIDGVGPAGAAFHTDKEYLRIDTIEERTNMMTRFLSLI